MSTDTLELIELDIDFDLEVQCEDEECDSGSPARWRTSHKGCMYLVCKPCRDIDIMTIMKQSHVSCQCGAEFVPTNTIRFYPL